MKVKVHVFSAIYRKDKLWVESGVYNGREFGDRWLIWLKSNTCTVINKSEGTI